MDLNVLKVAKSISFKFRHYESSDKVTDLIHQCLTLVIEFRVFLATEFSMKLLHSKFFVGIMEQTCFYNIYAWKN